MVKNLPASAGNVGDLGSIPGSGRSPGGWNQSEAWARLRHRPREEWMLLEHQMVGCPPPAGNHMLGTGPEALYAL